MRPVLTTSRPSHTMAQTGPLAMSVSGSVRVNFSQALATRTGDETLKEWLVAQVGVVLLKMVLGWRHELDGREFETVFDQQPIIIRGYAFDLPSLLEAADDLADKATLFNRVSQRFLTMVGTVLMNLIPERHLA